MEKTWNGWELCDSCGYRYNTITQTSPDDNKPIKMIVETDIGHDPDDFFALCYLFSAGVDIKAILISPGDESQIAIVDFLLKTLGKTDVLIGVPELGRRKEQPTNIHKALLDVYKFPYFSSNAVLSRQLAVDILTQHENIEFFGCGPLKTFGHIELPRPLNKAVMQGGFIGYDTHKINVKKLPKFEGKERCATFNLNGDRNGAHNFLNMDIKSRFFVGKNVCHYMVYDTEVHKKIMSIKPENRAAELFREGMEWRFKLNRDGKKYHDPTAAVLHLHPTIGCWVRAKPYCENGEWGSRLHDKDDFVLISVDEDKVWEHLAMGV
jgi:inosine-uridine nucleoside N-ribohydrolase